MPAVVVTSQGLQQIAATGKVESPETLPPLKREVIALKRSGQSPKAADHSEKVDDSPKTEVKPAVTGATPAEDRDQDGFTAAERAEYSAKVRKTMGEKHRRAKEAEEFAEFQRKGRVSAETRIKELEAELAKAKPAKSEDPPKAPATEPQPDQFPNVAAYTKALVKWERAQEAQQSAQQQEEAAETERASKASQSWQERLKAVMASNPDFESTVHTAFAGNDKQVAKKVIDEIEESDVGPQLLYHLAKHPDDLATFRSLNAEKQIKFLGRLEAKLEATATKDPDPKPAPQPAPAAKHVSRAPAPIDTSVGSAEVVRKDPRDMDTQEYLAMKRAERRARAR